MEAISLLYNLGKQQRELYLTPEDFHLDTEVIKLSYEFRGLSNQQKGAFYEYLVLTDDENKDFAISTIISPLKIIAYI
ncbi:hypothetical protein [Flavobacterium microcysteis]|uniref:hypothetical protein n=1 Tax=Flavobacterium microcysteis TaxID=2596891 RepID=UPI0013156138|nr:hypothetical protein [Flavobacterium microcysteis]